MYTYVGFWVLDPCCPGGTTQTMSTKVKARARIPRNKACRQGMLEGLTGKTAELLKDAGDAPGPKKNTNPKKKVGLLMIMNMDRHLRRLQAFKTLRT